MIIAIRVILFLAAAFFWFRVVGGYLGGIAMAFGSAIWGGGHKFDDNAIIRDGVIATVLSVGLFISLFF